MSRPIRVLAAVSLVLTALLSLVSVLTQPEFVASPADRLASIDAAGALGVVSVMCFAISQLPFLVGVVAVAALAHPRAPRTAWAGGGLAVLGGFGHSVFAGLGLAQLALAADSEHRAVLAQALDRFESGPAGPFMALGLLGTVLGLLFLGVALFRSGVVPRWVPVALWVFLVAEFALSNLSSWASPAATLIYLVAFGAIAARLLRDGTAPVSGRPADQRATVAAPA